MKEIRRYAVLYGVVLAAGVLSLNPVLSVIDLSVVSSPVFLVSVFIPLLVVFTALVSQDELSSSVVVWCFVLAVVVSSIPIVVNRALSFVAPEGSVQSVVLVTPALEEIDKVVAAALAGFGFRKKSSGLALGAVAGFGFAAFENTVFLSYSSLFIQGVARIPTATIHVISTSIFGYYVFAAKESSNPFPAVLKGFAVAWFLHASNNFFTATRSYRIFSLALVVLAFGVFVYHLDWWGSVYPGSR